MCRGRDRHRHDPSRSRASEARPHYRSRRPFVTHYLLHRLPYRAAAVRQARVASLMVEAHEVLRADWPVNAEHDSDARREFCIAAFAVAGDSKRYAKVAKLAGLTENDVRKAKDYGTEVHHSWRRMLQPLWMPLGEASCEARVDVPDGDALIAQLVELGLVQELESALRRFDWHSTVTIRFEQGDGTASGSRSPRAATVKAGYVLRSVAQGKGAGF